MPFLFLHAYWKSTELGFSSGLLSQSNLSMLDRETFLITMLTLLLSISLTATSCLDIVDCKMWNFTLCVADDHQLQFEFVNHMWRSWINWWMWNMKYWMFWSSIGKCSPTFIILPNHMQLLLVCLWSHYAASFKYTCCFSSDCAELDNVLWIDCTSHMAWLFVQQYKETPICNLPISWWKTCSLLQSKNATPKFLFLFDFGLYWPSSSRLFCETAWWTL